MQMLPFGAWLEGREAFTRIEGFSQGKERMLNLSLARG